MKASISHSLLLRLCLPVLALVMLGLPVAEATAAEVERATLGNGLRVILVRNTLAPAVAIQLNYLVGSVEAPPGFPGMAHAQEHMMFRGSPGVSPDQLSTILAATGGESNAETQQVVTQYLATVAADDLETMLRVEADRMRGALDTQASWNEERGAIEQEVDQDLSNPQYLMSVRLLENLFAGTPYEHDALGSRPSFDKTTAEMLQKFHREWYGPNNAVLVLVGDFDLARTMTKVRAIFGGIPTRPVPPRPVVELKPLHPAAIDLDSNLPYGLALVAYRLPGYDSPDFAAGQVLADVLETQRGNLYALVPEGKALATQVEEIVLPKAGAVYLTAAFPQGADGKGMVTAIKSIVADYLKTGISGDLVVAAVRHEVADAEFQKNSISGLASIWSQAVAVEGRHSPEDDIEAYRRVTVEDVNRVARAYLVNDTAVAALLTPRSSGKPVEAKAPTRGKEGFTPKSVKPARLPSWAAKLTRNLPAATIHKKPTVYHLSNGMRLMVLPTSTSDTVSVYGKVKNNPYLQTPAGKDGVNEVMEGLFSYGTTKLGRLPFLEALDEIAAEETAGATFSLKVLKAHFARGMELLSDNILHPALPEDAFKIVQKETADALTGELKSPDWFTERALQKGLYPKTDPKQRYATPESVLALTLDDIRNYHLSVFRPDLTTIVVIGAVTPEEAKSVVEKYFGAWRAQGPKPATDLPPVPPNRQTTVSVPDQSRVQDEVTLAETVGLTRSSPDYYPLQVGMNVLSGGFYATRLYRDLRERAGLVYAVEAFLQAGKTRTVFGVFYGCEPGNVGKARTMVEHNLNRMQKEPVSAAELHQAKTLLLRHLLLSRTSAASIAGELLDLVQLGLPLDEPEREDKRYRSVTAQQVRKAFKRWLRLDGFVQVSKGPEPL